MVLKQQEPPHPGRFAEVRGLDRRLWQLALHCWKLGPAPALTINDAADDLSAPRDDILRCPFEWDTESLRTWTSRSAPSLDRQICSVRKIKAGRDVENRAYEITGVRMYRRNVLVNIISPHVCRRGNLKVEHVRANATALFAMLTLSPLGVPCGASRVEPATAPERPARAGNVYLEGGIAAWLCRSTDVRRDVRRLPSRAQ